MKGVRINKEMIYRSLVEYIYTIGEDINEIYNVIRIIESNMRNQENRE
jgi:hypothetical protein